MLARGVLNRSSQQPDEGGAMKRRIGTAKRVHVRKPFSADAWDCRQFGFGRVVAPQLPVAVEIAPGVELHLRTGEVTVAAHQAL
jgi:hypothetical protein